jgi:hypothetical protein
MSTPMCTPQSLSNRRITIKDGAAAERGFDQVGVPGQDGRAHVLYRVFSYIDGLMKITAASRDDHDLVRGDRRPRFRRSGASSVTSR